jgi:hypothetical protein
MNVPCSSTPAGPLRSATAAHWCCLPPSGQRRLPRLFAFRAQSHGPRTRCLRFAEWVAPLPRKTHFRIAGQPFRAGLITHWVLMKVSGFIPSSSPRLRLAHPNSVPNSGPGDLVPLGPVSHPNRQIGASPPRPSGLAVGRRRFEKAVVPQPARQIAHGSIHCLAHPFHM